MKKLIFLCVSAVLLSGCNSGKMKVTVTNTLDIARTSEIVEIPYSSITSNIPGVLPSEIVVEDNTGKEITSQVIYEGNPDPLTVIFQADVKGKSRSVYYIKKGTPSKYEARAYGRFVPERMDDYAWENDRIAFRIYGTALIAKDGPSNGLDVWVKRTDKMVVDKWYADYLAGKSSYHNDNGEGCDCFKVGRTLGAGAMAPYIRDSLWLAINFESHQTLDNGPLRTSFKLAYPAFLADSILVNETRIISLDAGSQLTRITEEYTGPDEVFSVAAGIVKRAEGKTLVTSTESGIITYRLDIGENGVTYIGTLIMTPVFGILETPDHLLIKTIFEPGKSLTYYTGAGWSKWGFENDEQWVSYMKDYSLKLHNPLLVILN
jgi:hypothetical protein